MTKITIYGDPEPKGSMKCVGGRGPVRHQLIPSNQKSLKAWEAKIATAAAAAVQQGHGPYSEALSISITITVPRPASVPLSKRPWPITRSAGDIDKHERSILDGLTAGGILSDDAIVCHTENWECYSDTPGCPDRLGRPGVVIRIDPIPEMEPDHEPTLI